MKKTNGQSTAKKAIQILTQKTSENFVCPNDKQRRNLILAFAEQNLTIYGRAFDIIKLSKKVNLDDPADIKKKIGAITIFEIKSTNRKMNKNFDGYFFSLSTAELLVAQNLKSRFKFVFVDTTTKHFKILELNDIFKQAKSIYPVWSIRF